MKRDALQHHVNVMEIEDGKDDIQEDGPAIAIALSNN